VAGKSKYAEAGKPAEPISVLDHIRAATSVAQVNAAIELAARYEMASEKTKRRWQRAAEQMKKTLKS